MSLRICTATFEQLMELSGDERKFKGLLAPQYEFLVDNVWRFFPNASYTSSNKLGEMDMVTMMYDGCLGRLQRNESDVALPVVTLPSLGSGLMHGTTASASKVVMWSVYNNTATPSDTDVMDAFNSFTAQLWLLTFLTSAILTFVLFMMFRFKLLPLPESNARGTFGSRLTKRQRTRRCVHQALLIVTANVLKQHTSYTYRGKLLRRKAILLLFAVFSFLMINYFSSMIKTEMVVQKRPETISTYEELLAKPNLKPIWPMNLNVHWEFMNADRNTAEGHIWERAKRMGLDSCMIKSDADIKQNIDPLNRREAIWLGPSTLIGVTVTNACAFHHSASLYPDVNMWYKSDENAREKLNVMMLSAALHLNSVKNFHRIIQADLEHHVLFQALKRLEFSVFPDTGSKTLRDCVANRIIYPDYEIGAVHLPHYSRLLHSSVYGLLFCLLVLSSEMMAKMCRRLTAQKKREAWTLVRGSVIP